MTTKGEAAEVLRDQLEVARRTEPSEDEFIIVTVDTPGKRACLVETLELAIQALES